MKTAIELFIEWAYMGHDIDTRFTHEEWREFARIYAQVGPVKPVPVEEAP